MHKYTRKVFIYSIFVALLMFGATFALVPVYRSICLVTGLSTAKLDPSILPDKNREILVQFVATNNSELPWDFYPEKTSLTVHPGENAKVVFIAKNKSGKTMTVQAIPSYAPIAAVKFFHKIECFCFAQQSLAANEIKHMPVVFRLDSNLPKDMDTITLAYTLFDVTDQQGTES